MTDDSPLKEASLQELFARNPEDISDAEFQRIIADFRHERHNWNKTETAKRAAPKKGEKVSPSLDQLLDGI